MAQRNDGGPAGSLPLVSGGHTLVDPQDREGLSEVRWRVGSNGYVYRCGGRSKGRPCLLHRIVINAAPEQQVHHLNGNKLDNRRENLELTTASEHQARYHREAITKRNRERRTHDEFGICGVCGNSFAKHPDHRDRQKVCSKDCAIKAMIDGRRKRHETA